MGKNLKYDPITISLGKALWWPSDKNVKGNGQFIAARNSGNCVRLGLVAVSEVYINKKSCQVFCDTIKLCHKESY